jgi:hypothetical protein
MTTGATGQLGLALPVQGELSGTWGDTVNNGITQYTNIAIAGTLTLTNDGAVTLANTTGDASASNITSSLTGAGTVTAQFAIVKVIGTLTTAKVVTAPSYSKTYTVVNAATGGIVTFKASGQTGVSIAVGETAFVYFNGTDYVKVVGTATAGAAGGSNTQVQFNSSGVLAGSSNMTFDGTTLTANALTVTNAVTLSGGTANGIVYLNGSKVMTSGSSLSYDGTTTSFVGRLYNGSASTFGASSWAMSLGNGGVSANYFKGDTTYFQNSSGTQIAQLDSTGLGIGASSPSFKLQVSGAQNANDIVITNTTISSSLRMQMIDAYGNLFTTGSYPLTFGTNSSERARIDTSGNLGVGTTSPSTYGKLVSYNVSGGAYAIAAVGNDQSNTRIRIRNTGGADFTIVGGTPGLSNAGLAIFDETNSATRMLIDSSGNVNIGTTTTGVGKMVVQYTSTLANPLAEANAGLNLWGNSSVRLLFGTNPSSPFGAYIQASNTGAGFPICLNPSGGGVFIGANTGAGVLTLGGSGGLQQYFISTSAFNQINSIVSLCNNGSTYSTQGFDAYDYRFNCSGTEVVRFIENSMVGIGVTPIQTTYQTIQFPGEVLHGCNLYNASVSKNLYYNAGWKFVTGGQAGAISDVGSGEFNWYSTGTSTGTAGGAASATLFMQLSNAGYLLLNSSAVSNARIAIGCASGTQSIAFAIGSGVTRASGTQYGYTLYRDNTTETSAVTFVENGGSGNNSASYVVRTNAATGGTGVTNVSGGVALVNGATSWSSYSDLRLKHDVVPVTNAIDSILKIDPIFFKWNDRPADQQRSIGVSAQSVEKVFPELIDRSGIYDVEGGAMQVRYTELIPVLLASIQEQQAIIESLKARLDAANI